MKITSITLLPLIPFLFGCASSTVQTYSADFKAYPVETEGVGVEHIASDGEIYITPQLYRFECVLHATTQPRNGESTTRILSSPSVVTGLGYGARVGVMGDGVDDGGSMFEVKFYEQESEYHARLKVTYKEPGSDPIVRSSIIIIKK